MPYSILRLSYRTTSTLLINSFLFMTFQSFLIILVSLCLDVDMHEFFSFIEGERHTLHLDPQHEKEELQKSIRNTRTVNSSYSRDTSPLRPSTSRTGRSMSPNTRTGYSSTSITPSPSPQRNRNKNTNTRSKSPSYGSSSGKQHYDNNDSNNSINNNSNINNGMKEMYNKGIAERNTGKENRKANIDFSDENARKDRNDDSKHRSYNESNDNDSYYNDNNNKNHNDHYSSDDDNNSDGNNVSSLETLWATKMLQAQAHVESRLGNRYY